MDGDIPQDDGLKWFGEGFEGFPKRLPEDCVEYVLYVIDEKLADGAALRSRLNAILKIANNSKKNLLQDYIWQRDDFELKMYPNATVQAAAALPRRQTGATPHLKGRTNFGDSIADEWLIVYLLVELSKQCPDAWIRMYDTDGEFLLIEAANALPKWLNPDIAENRVWINNGHIRLIPLENGASRRNLSLDDALSFIRHSHDRLIISPFVEDEAFFRLRDYPAAISSSLHHALVTVPRRLIHILRAKPAYISPAIEAFYLRDHISLKPLATKDIATLRFPPEDFVTATVKITKVGYAQLRSQVFDTPPAWTGVIPRLSDQKVEIGMKLTCGFEMLLSDPQNKDKRAVREIKILLEDIETGEEALPLDKEIEGWPKIQDDEKWLDIDYNDFENELSGKKGGDDKEQSTTFGDQGAQNNLRKMVSRFEDFLIDDEAGAEGVDDEDDGADDETTTDEEDNTQSDAKNDASLDEEGFEQAMNETRSMAPDQVEESGLLEEARRLALEDEKEGAAPNEEEELRKVMEMMEQELKGHGALDIDEKPLKAAATGKDKAKTPSSKRTVHFGPERPPQLQGSNGAVVKSSGATDNEEADEEIGPGDEELSSDDEEFNDVDLGLAKNMLEAFKGQAGMAGPAGNLMRALGVGMPRDEGGGDDP